MTRLLLEADTYTSSSKMEEETIVKMRAEGSLHFLFRDKIIDRDSGRDIDIEMFCWFVGHALVYK